MSEAKLRPSPTIDVPRLDTSTSFRKEAYAALKRAITAMDIYDHADEIRLRRYVDELERRLQSVESLVAVRAERGLRRLFGQ